MRSLVDVVRNCSLSDNFLVLICYLYLFVYFALVAVRLRKLFLVHLKGFGEVQMQIMLHFLYFRKQSRKSLFLVEDQLINLILACFRMNDLVFA